MKDTKYKHITAFIYIFILIIIKIINFLFNLIKTYLINGTFTFIYSKLIKKKNK